MAVASNDLPRFSLLAGASGVYARALTEESEGGILRCLSGDFTWEAWIQIRAVKGSALSEGVGHGCWWVHSPAWACGLTADRSVLVVDGGDWYMSVPTPAGALSSRRWHHLAVCRRAQGRACEVLVDGERVQLGTLQDSERLRLPLAPSAGFRVGWTPLPDSPCELLLHEVRLWSTYLPEGVVRRWLSASATAEHPSATHLHGHWSFSSGFPTPTEYDLSGRGHDLTIRNATPVHWLRATPPSFHRSATSEVARLVAYQEVDTERRSERVQFVVELEVLPQLDVAYHAYQVATVVLMINFSCFPSPSLTSASKGTGLIHSLQQFVQRLPRGFGLAIYDASGWQEHVKQPVLWCTALDDDAKTRACRALGRLVVKKSVAEEQVTNWVVASVQDAKFTHRRDSEGQSRFVCTVVFVTDHSPRASGQELLSGVDDLQSANSCVNLHVVQVGAAESLANHGLEQVSLSCLVAQHIGCENDFEWVLAVILARTQELVLTGADLSFDAFGDASFFLTEQSQPVFHRYTGSQPLTHLVIPVGSCAFSKLLRLTGFATFPTKPPQAGSLIAVTLTYFSSYQRRHVSRVSVRSAGDITDHLYIERTLRNKRLKISDGDVQLLEQRRALMRRKMTFVSEFVSHEIAEAENAFKKVNIMKEELWAKRKWLVGRGLRLFEETELQSLSEEAKAARSAFTRRTESLQSAFTASSRGSDPRGSGRGKNNAGPNALRVHVGEESKEVSEIIGSDGEEEKNDEQKLQKVCVKLSVQGKALDEHEAKMEELFVSVRLAEAKGPVIMNDTRRSWMVRYHDMISCKKAVIDSTLTKHYLEWLLEFNEERDTTRQEVEAEVQSTNTIIARFDKELTKRRKRALLCTKEVVGGIIDEFEASERVEDVKRNAMKCRLMKTLALTQDMYASCIYVCFPMEISQHDVPTKDSSAKGFTNLVHGLCAGLRQICDDTSESPVCCRLAFNEAFLWWGLEQQDTRPTTEELIATANREARRAVQSKAWAFIVVTYNSLFSSAAATAEVKNALATARDQAKPVFHIKLESQYEGLEDFRSKWTHRIQNGNANTTAPIPVEREFLTWRQNFSSFQGLIASIGVVETVVTPNSLGMCDCTHGVDSVQGDASWRYPCLECMWPLLGSSRLAVARDEEAADSPQVHQSRWFLRLLRQIGAWVDTTNSVLLQTAPRSYHIDPNGFSLFSREWDMYQHKQIRQFTSKWSEALTQRTKEIQRQVGKLFKVYEEEAHDIVVLQFKLFKRRREVLESMSDQLNNLVDERKLLETWVEKLDFDETGTDHGRRSKENERMVSEELWQRMHEADAETLRLEALEDQLDSRPDEELVVEKSALDAVLRHGSRAILDLGRGHIEDRYRSLTRAFKREEYINQIKIANAKCYEQRAQISRMEDVFDQAERIVRALRNQRDAFVREDAGAFINASYLELHSPPSATTQNIDHPQLQKLARDLDFHSAFCASIMSQVLQSQLASSTAAEYRAKVQQAICSFSNVYAPSTRKSDDVDAASRALAAGFKDFCQFVPEEPKKSYESLLAMRELIDKEALEDREIQRVWGEWKMRFLDAVMVSHTERWWTQCRVLLEFTRELLSNVKSALDKSYVSRCDSEREFREAVADREKLNHRLALLQRRLIETRQRQQSLLLLLQISRKCYETSSAVMNAKLQNVKTDVMFKNWSGISEYHVEMIGNLFDWRSHCSQQLDSLEADIKNCQERLALCDGIIDNKRQAWIKHSIADTMACTKAEGQQQLAHRTVELILSLERQRVFKQFQVLDPRGLWLSLPTLTTWHDTYLREYQREVDLRKGGGKQTVAVGRSSVDDLLVQLSIARLDVIKQEKLRDALHRKLDVLERIYNEQVELRHIVESEAQLYHSLGCRLAERVSFLREQYEASGESEYLQLGIEDNSNVVSSIDRRSAVKAVRESRDLISDMIKLAQQDYLRLEATACQIAWRMREHIACGCRGERAIEAVQSDLVHVEGYLQVLKTKDSELFNLCLRNELPEAHGTVGDTHSMGMDIASGRAVFDFYARDQWFRNCLDQTTALGERIKSLREVLSSLMGIQQSATRLSAREADGGSRSVSEQADDDSTGEGGAVGQDEQLVILEQELQSTELALLLNRFESRRAEKTSEAVKVAITNRFEGGAVSIYDGVTDDDQRDLDTVFPEQKLQSRMFSVAVYATEQERMIALLRELATSFDPRDVAGNLSEVIFGASLDRNDLKVIFLLQSRAHVEEQWGVALVAFFFARLFRRASLNKAAAIRNIQASALAREKLNLSSHHLRVARAVIANHLSQLHQTGPLSLSESSVKRLRDLQLCVEVVGEVDYLQRLALGIVMHQPFHRVLAPLMSDGAKSVCHIADEMEQQRAVAEHRPPKPTHLQATSTDRYSIKIEWKPVAMDRDLVYVAEISEHSPPPEPLGDHTSKRYWTQFQTTEKTSHSFYNLHPGHSYWVRVRSGFSRTRLGSPCLPLLVTTLAE